MMAFAWTNTEADCTIVSSEPPAAGIVHVEIEDGTDPGTIWVSESGAIMPVPPRPAGHVIFSPAAGAWIDPRTDAECLDQLRQQRDSILRSCDWTQASDAPLTAEQVLAWRSYRIALRDLPATTADPRNPQWPLPPAE